MFVWLGDFRTLDVRAPGTLIFLGEIRCTERFVGSFTCGSSLLLCIRPNLWSMFDTKLPVEIPTLENTWDNSPTIVFEVVLWVLPLHCPEPLTRAPQCASPSSLPTLPFPILIQSPSFPLLPILLSLSLLIPSFPFLFLLSLLHHSFHPSFLYLQLSMIKRYKTADENSPPFLSLSLSLLLRSGVVNHLLRSILKVINNPPPPLLYSLPFFSYPPFVFPSSPAYFPPIFSIAAIYTSPLSLFPFLRTSPSFLIVIGSGRGKIMPLLQVSSDVICNTHYSRKWNFFSSVQIDFKANVFSFVVLLGTV